MKAISPRAVERSDFITEMIFVKVYLISPFAVVVEDAQRWPFSIAFYLVCQHVRRSINFTNIFFPYADVLVFFFSVC